ncbi:transposase [Rhodococcus artemisiae]|uniref:Transposase n=2 Tax=Rhodococcus artemisiae TaxID=714159 RepID=A0ABU7LCS8_9NOCA|nr:transposase [Rhodococcus artemisiae]
MADLLIRDVGSGDSAVVIEAAVAAGSARCPRCKTDACPQLAAVRRHVGAFAVMMRDRRGDRLQDWIDRVRADDLPALHSFTTGVEHDFTAVAAGLTLAFSNGPTEGAVTRIKALKRQMYGRAGLDLLRKRVLHPN